MTEPGALGVLLALGLAAVFVVVARPLVVAVRGADPARSGRSLWLLALLALAAWVRDGYLAGVRADETATRGDVLSDPEWLLVAVVVAGVAVVRAWRASGPSRD